ncbi:MAG: hypothetical protein ACRDHL_11505 [Candidatus Promineifilaceae bacterium]
MLSAVERILALALYLFQSLLLSLAGLLYTVASLAFYIVIFDPRQHTPDFDYYFLVVGLYGAGLAFLVTLSAGSRANQAENFPFLARLPSRAEFLSATFLAALAFTLLLQFVLALAAAALNGPMVSLWQLASLPPVWLAADILFVALALHASDLVAHNWSRSAVYGALAVLLYARGGSDQLGGWLVGAAERAGNGLLGRGRIETATVVFRIGDWLGSTFIEALEGALSLFFWPFAAIRDAALAGQFSPVQALAPTVLLFYAAILYLLAADFFATKDLYLTE